MADAEVSMPNLSDFCPFVGIRPYSDKESNYFFGRERDTRVICSNLALAPLTILYGASGVGKSSLLQASVGPNLAKRPRTVVLYFRDWQEANFASRLRTALVTAVGEAGKKASPDSPKLLDPSRPLDDLAADARRSGNFSLLLILDQFEDYLLANAPSEDEKSFEAELARAINREDCPVNILIALREDALSMMDRFRPRIPNLLGNILRLGFLDREAAENAVRMVIEAYNEASQKGWGVYIPDSSSNDNPLPAVMKGASHEGNAIEAAFLQLVMKSLWECETTLWKLSGRAAQRQLRLSTLNDRLGGASHVINTHIDHALEPLSDADRHIAFGLFRALVGGTGNRIPRYLGDFYDYVSDSDKESAQSNIVRVLKFLGQSDIVRPIPTNRYEISHDVLARAVLAWRTKYEQSLALEEARREAAQKEKARSEREALVQLKRWRLILGAACLVLIGGSVLLYRSIKKAESNIIALAANSALNNDAELSIIVADYAITHMDTPRARDALYHGIETSRARLTLRHTDGVYGVDFSADGKLIATASTDGTVEIWSATGQHLLQVLKQEKAIGSLAFAKQMTDHQTMLVTGSDDYTAKIWTIEQIGDKLSKKLVGTLKHPDEVWGVAFSADGKWIATASQDRIARVWNVRECEAVLICDKPFRTFDGPTRELIQSVLSPNGLLLAAASLDHTATIWEVNSGKPLQVLREHSDSVYGVAFDNSGTRLATTGWDGKVVIVKDPSGKFQDNSKFETHEIKTTVNKLWGVAFSPDGTRLAVAGRNGKAMIFDPETGEELIKLSGNATAYTNLAFDSAGRQLITGTENDFAKVWDVSLISLHSWPSTIRRVTFTSDGKTVAAAGSDKSKTSVTLWDTASGRVSRVLPHSSEVRGVAFSDDGQKTATATDEGIVRIWATSAESEPVPLLKETPSPKQIQPVYGVAFDPSGPRLATAGWDRTVTLWDLTSRKEIDHSSFKNRMYSVALNHEGTLLAAGGESAERENKVFLFDLSDKTLHNRHELEPPHNSIVHVLAFSSDGRHLAAGLADGSAIVWDVGDLTRLGAGRRLIGHLTAIHSVMFSHDGSTIATASEDGTAMLWNLKTGRRLRTFYGHKGSVWSLTFSDDGRKVVTIGNEGSLLPHIIDTRELDQLKESRITRSMTEEDCRLVQLDPCPSRHSKAQAQPPF